MIKFRILNYILILVVALCLLGVLLLAFMLYTFYSRPEFGPDELTIAWVALIKVLLLTIAFSFTKQGIGNFLREGYFNAKSARFLTIAGYIMAISSLITLIFNFTEITYVDKDSVASYSIEIIYDIIVLLIGLALLGVTDIIKKGTAMKLENDLTI